MILRVSRVQPLQRPLSFTPHFPTAILFERVAETCWHDPDVAEKWITPTPAVPLTGEEQFSGMDATVRDFWSYAFRDLRTNTTRGLLAEFLVSRAVGAAAPQPEWSEYDVLTPDGVRVEVKSSAYLQSWGQRQLSQPRFDRLTARTWSPEVGDAEARTHNADAYVFCVQTATTHSEYDPLDISQWEFYVLSRRDIAATGYRSIGLVTLRSLTAGPTTYDALAGAIQQAVRDPE